MKISTSFPSKYLRAADIEDRSVQVIMSHVDMETVGDTDTKPVLYFSKHEKGLILNKVNSKAIANVYGDETDAWRGKPIILFTAMVEFRGDTVLAIRVRVPKQPGAKISDKISSGPLPPIHHETENPADDLEGLEF